MRRHFWTGWWAVGGLWLLWALAQQVVYPPDFGPYEPLRQQAHAQCQGYLAQGAQAYVMCLQQLSAGMCMGPYAPRMDPMSSMACTAAVSAGYPASGKPVLTQPSYRVEVVGGVERKRDLRTGQVVEETPVTPHLLFTLEQTPQGVYRGITYSSDGRSVATYFVSTACELLDPRGQPTMDGLRCPVYPEKPFLLVLLDPPAPGFPPNPLRFAPGRLADDFDQDGVLEIGYMATAGSGGRTFTSGWVQALGYDPASRLLKYEYLMAVREGESQYTSYAQERLVRFRVR